VWCNLPIDVDLHVGFSQMPAPLAMLDHDHEVAQVEKGRKPFALAAEHQLDGRLGRLEREPLVLQSSLIRSSTLSLVSDSTSPMP
jgi:hypothetical protein